MKTRKGPAEILVRITDCPNCGARVSMVPYDIGSGPELSCHTCEWCWGADGQDLKPLPPPTRTNLVAQGFDDAHLPKWLK